MSSFGFWSFSFLVFQPSNGLIISYLFKGPYNNLGNEYHIFYHKGCLWFPRLGGVHKLCWQVFGLFDHLPPCVDIFYFINVNKNKTFLHYLPTSSGKRSLWTPPYEKWNEIFWRISALASKIGQIKKKQGTLLYKLLIREVINIIQCLYFFDLTHFRG